MSKPWTEHLKPSEVSVLNSFIEQVPEDHGARAAIIGIIQNLADSPADPKIKYVVVQDGDVVGTNDLEEARQLADDEGNYVIDVVNNKWMTTADEDDDSEILEV